MKNRRLLLIAMSGVRVKNEELLELGLTLPGFVERGRVIASLPSLSLLTVAAHTPANWSVDYREIDALTDADFQAIVSGGYDLVGLSSLSARILDAYVLADKLRNHGITVVIGGLHASMLPAETGAHADAVVCGEAETQWPRLIGDFQKGELQPVYTSLEKSQKAFSFDEALLPRFDLLEIERYNRLTLQTSRGCPLDCHFCGASRLISRYKIKPIERVRRELDAIVALWPKPFIELADDNSFANKRWSRELAALLGEYDIPWFTETDISVADDDELLELLAASNCAQLLIGLESTESISLYSLDGRHWKHSQRSSYLEKIAKIQSYGIAVNGCFILGFDEDDAGVFERTRDFVLASELADVQITVLTPFPGTALYRQLLAEDRLLKPVYWDQCTLFDVTFGPKQMSVTELESGFRQLMAELYSADNTTQRKRRFRECTRTRRKMRDRVAGGNL